MHGIGFAILAFLCAVALLVVLMWPSRSRKR
jgi:hypothetical protein